jgi:hypothetical protein
MNASVYAPRFLFVLVVVSILFVSACERGEYDTKVDAEPRYGFDKTATPMVDREAPPTQPTQPNKEMPVVLDETHEEYVPPPTQQVRYDEGSRFVGKDAVRFWIWNNRGSAQLLLAEGETASITSLQTTIHVDSIGVGNKGETALLVLDGEALPLTHEREEVRVGSTYVFISEILLNEAQEPTCTGENCALTTQCATSKEGIYCFSDETTS